MHKFYVQPGNYSHFIRFGLLERETWEENPDQNNPFAQSNFVWRPTNISVGGYTKLDNLMRNHPKDFIQIFNHFEDNRGICTKTGLIRSLRKYYNELPEAKLVKYGVFDSTATSFLITAGQEDYEYGLFVTRFRDIAKQTFFRENVPAKHCTNNFWLVKPANLNQGRGIAVFKSLRDINNFLASKAQNTYWVIQKYIERPLLYNGRKFDLRIWAIFTGANEVFIYKKAYVRTSSDTYDLANPNNYVHLTNQCLQVNGANYGKHEEGNTLSLEELDAYIKEKYAQYGASLDEHVKPRIRDLIIDTYLCWRKQLNPNRRKNVFELFGYDFLIDEDLRTWLIEVNTNPYLGTPNEYMVKLVPQMVDDMLELVVDPIIPTKRKEPKNRTNEFQLVFCEQGSRYHDGPLNLRSPYHTSLYPIKDLAPPDYIKKWQGYSSIDWKTVLASPSPRKIEKSIEAKSVNRNEKFVNNNKYIIRSIEGGSGFVRPHALNLITRFNQGKGSVAMIETERKLRKEGTIEVDTDGKDNNRASSVEERTQAKADSQNIEAIYKSLHLALIYKSSSNINNVSGQLNRIFSSLQNWEILSDKYVKMACKTLNLIAQSGSSFLLTEPANIRIMSKLLMSPDINQEIKIAVLDAITYLSKDTATKKRLLCDRLLQDLFSIVLSSCITKPAVDFGKLVRLSALKCLEMLGGVFNRKIYIPGETKEMDKIRGFFTSQGGVVTIWILATRSTDDEIKEIASKNLMQNLDISDWERQQLFLRLYKPAIDLIHTVCDQRMSPILADEDENKTEEVNKAPIEDEDAELLFYSTGELFFIEKAVNQKDKAALETRLNFPKIILQIAPYDKVVDEFNEFIRLIKELRKDQEERERKAAEIEKAHTREMRRIYEEKPKGVSESQDTKLKIKKQTDALKKSLQEQEINRQKDIEERSKYLEPIMIKKQGDQFKLKTIQKMRKDVEISPFARAQKIFEKARDVKTPETSKRIHHNEAQYDIHQRRLSSAVGSHRRIFTAKGTRAKIFYDAGSDSDGEESKEKAAAYFQRENPLRATLNLEDFKRKRTLDEDYSLRASGMIDLKKTRDLSGEDDDAFLKPSYRGNEKIAQFDATPKSKKKKVRIKMGYSIKYN